ncbi:MAG: hypothetical protein IKS74_00105, partial [Methanomicrobium sp.]|nr:hypothetical protein [Methanomicrobium sp.]
PLKELSVPKIKSHSRSPNIYIGNTSIGLKDNALKNKKRKQTKTNENKRKKKKEVQNDWKSNKTRKNNES